jgi:oxaloacetate decarboxylase (Na+ extruding) subunit alpha
VRLQVSADGTTYHLEVDSGEAAGLMRVTVDDREYLLDVTNPAPGVYSLLIDRKVLTAYVWARRGKLEVQIGAWTTSVEVSPLQGKRPMAKAAAGVAGRQEITAPMSGRIIQVLVHSEQAVQEGDSLVIVEAMKMETEIRAPISGLVKEVQVQPGMAVETGQLLLVVEGS